MSKRRPKSNHQEQRTIRALDQLAQFEDYCDEVLPLLRQAISEGWSRDKIDAHPKIQALLAARQITIALKEQDSAKAMTAIKDHRDRTQGRPTEKQEIEHRYSKLKDDELDSLLLSQITEAGDVDNDDSRH